MKDNICKHCGAVNQHFSFQCHTQRKPIKKSNISFGDTFKYGMINSEGKVETLGEIPNTILKPLTSEIKSSKPTYEKVKVRGKKHRESLPELLRLTEIVVNKWIRTTKSIEGATKFKCTCCNDWFPIDEIDAGHMFAKTYSAIRFHEDNLWPQSQKCNRLEYGNVEAFKENVRLIIGEERFNALEKLKHTEKKWNREELQEIINKFKI